ncbi:hypothetical protein PENTCL1PPCAC_11299, partial [Pristionchus entomophagus]
LCGVVDEIRDFLPSSLIHPLRVMVVGVVRKLIISEPKGDLPCCGCLRVTSVTHVTSCGLTEVSSNCTGCRLEWIRRSKHGPSLSDDVHSLPHHGDYWSRSHVCHQFREEGTLTQFVVVHLRMFFGCGHHLESDQ